MSNQKHKSVFRRPNKDKYFASDRTWMQDPRLSIQATGLLAKMLSMPEDWEFHQAALVKSMPDGKDSIRTAMKECGKYGYLIKLPPNRNSKGQFDGVEYEVFDTPQFEVEMADELVDSWFSLRPNWSEIQKKIAVAEFPHSVKPPLQYNPTDYKTQNNLQVQKASPEEAGKPASCCKEPPSTDLKKKKIEQLQKTDLKENQIMAIVRNYTLDDISKAVEMASAEKVIKSPYSWLCRCMREKWWLTADPEKQDGYYIFSRLKEILSQIRQQGATAAVINIEEKYIHISKPGEGGFEMTPASILNIKDYKTLVDSLNKRFLSPEKVNYDTVSGKITLEIVNENNV